MSNSLVSHAVGYINALFKDVRFLYTKGHEWERDKSRLTHELACNGLAVLTIHLPALSKHFDLCLGREQYSHSGLYLGGIASKRMQVPAFLRSLHLLVFDDEGKLRADPSVDAIAAIRQVYKGLTKVKLSCTRRRVIDELKEFKIIEEVLRSPTLNWVGDDLGELNAHHDRESRISFADCKEMLDSPEAQYRLPGFEKSFSIPEQHVSILQQVCDRIASSLGDFHDESDEDFPKHGKGRVSNQPRRVSKYSFWQWTRKLDSVFAYDYYARTDFGTGEDHDRDEERMFTNHEPPSKLIAVPKTQKGPRLIASEPNMHQWLQGLVANQLIARSNRTVLRNCVDISDQRNNQFLALYASFSGSHATVDLKSASDRLSLWTLERAFRANLTLLERIHATRTRTLRNAIEPSMWHSIVLKKAFTQGSALTFPGQTVIYSMIAIASVLISRNWRCNSRNIANASKTVQVYGDDIIIPVDALPVLLSFLEFCQLKVNLTKTFHTGKFRESCGTDAYDGVDVTPKYVKVLDPRPDHESLESAIEASNNLHLGGWWNLAGWQSSAFRRYRNLIPTVARHDNTLGIKSFCGRDYTHLESRYSKHLHTTEYRSLKLVGKTKRGDTAGSYRLYQFFIDRRRPALFSEYESGTIVDASSVMKKGWIPLQP